jgi:hypothetical protein
MITIIGSGQHGRRRPRRCGEARPHHRALSRDAANAQAGADQIGNADSVSSPVRRPQVTLSSWPSPTLIPSVMSSANVSSRPRAARTSRSGFDKWDWPLPRRRLSQ